MNKKEFLLYLVKHKLYTKKKVLLSCFAIINLKDQDDPTRMEPYTFYRTKGKVVFHHPISEGSTALEGETRDALIPIEDFREGKALYMPEDEITFEKGELPNVFEKQETIVGIALVNILLLIYPFGEKIPFINDEIGYGDLESRVIKAVDAKEVSVKELRTFLKVTLWAVGIMPIFIAPASPKSITGAPGIRETRNRLIRENAGNMDDPTTIAKIESELAGIDKEYIKGDVTEKFYKSGKAFNVTRKRMYGTFGAETDIANPSKVVMVNNSLEEEWDLTKLEPMINSLRMGSFKRGAETALGGSDFKDLSRMFQNVRIVKGDCGSKVGKPIMITKENIKRMQGRTDMKGNLMTMDSLKPFLGKRLVLRSPMTCQSPGTSFCETCVGTASSGNPTAVGMLAANLGATLMGIMMSAMHGNALKLQELDLNEVLS